MTLSRVHMGIALVLAMALHAALAWWLVLPRPQSFLEPVRDEPLRVSLLAAVAPETVIPAPVSPPVTAPDPPPVSPPSPEPVPESASVPEAVVPPPEPQPETELEFEVAPSIEEPHPMQATPPPGEMPPEPLPAPPETSTPQAQPLDAQALARYEQLLVAWLEKHKKYPRRARRLRIEGEGLLRILIDRGGRLQEVVLARRTGNRLLDKAALEMARRADPYPPLPEGDPRPAREFVVPVAFVLR